MRGVGRSHPWVPISYSLMLMAYLLPLGKSHSECIFLSVRPPARLDRMRFQLHRSGSIRFIKQQNRFCSFDWFENCFGNWLHLMVSLLLLLLLGNLGNSHRTGQNLIQAKGVDLCRSSLPCAGGTLLAFWEFFFASSRIIVRIRRHIIVDQLYTNQCLDDCDADSFLGCLMARSFCNFIFTARAIYSSRCMVRTCVSVGVMKSAQRVGKLIFGVR